MKLRMLTVLFLSLLLSNLCFASSYTSLTCKIISPNEITLKSVAKNNFLWINQNVEGVGKFNISYDKKNIDNQYVSLNFSSDDILNVTFYTAIAMRNIGAGVAAGSFIFGSEVHKQVSVQCFLQ